MQAKDAEAEIVRSSSPVVLPPSATVMQAGRHMHVHNMSAVLVVDSGGALIGIFTGRDAVSRILAEGRDPAKTILADVMTYNPVVIAPHHTALDALRMMQETHCRHMPIVEDGKVVGLVSRGDFRDKDSERFDE